MAAFLHQKAPKNTSAQDADDAPVASLIRRKEGFQTQRDSSYLHAGEQKNKVSHSSRVPESSFSSSQSFSKMSLSSGPTTSRYVPHDSRLGSRNDEQSMKGTMPVQRVEQKQKLRTGVESNSRVEDLTFAPSHRLHSPINSSSFPQSQSKLSTHSLSASSKPPATPHPLPSPPGDGSNDIVPNPSLSKSNPLLRFRKDISAGHTGHTGEADSKGDLSSSPSSSSSVSSTVPVPAQGPALLAFINPKTPQKGRRISMGSKGVTSSTVSSLTSTSRPSTIYPSLSINGRRNTFYSRQNPSNPPTLTNDTTTTGKFYRKSSLPQDRQTPPRVMIHDTILASRLGCSDREHDDAHESQSERACSSVRVQGPETLAENNDTIRHKLASFNAPGTGSADLSSDSSESSSSSSHSSLSSITYPIRASPIFVTPQSTIAPSTTIATNQEPLSSDFLNSNFLSSSHQAEGEGETIKQLPSSNMSAVNTSFNNLSAPPSQTVTSSQTGSSKMMPHQFSNFYYPPQMMMPNGLGVSNPLVFAATVDPSGRPLAVDLSVMQRHMLNPYHLVPSVSSSRPLPKTSVPSTPYPSGKFTAPRDHHSASHRLASDKADRRPSIKPVNPSSQNVPKPSSRTVPCEKGRLHPEAQRHAQVPESKIFKIPNSNLRNPHNQRHDARTLNHPADTSRPHVRVNDSMQLSARSNSHRLPNSDSVNVDHRRVSSSSASQYHRYSTTSCYSHTSIHQYPGAASPNVATQPTSASASAKVGEIPEEVSVEAADDIRASGEASNEVSSIPQVEEILLKLDGNGGSPLTLDEAIVSEERAEKGMQGVDEVQSTSSSSTAVPSAKEDSGSELESELEAPPPEKEMKIQGPKTYFPLVLFLFQPDLLAPFLSHLSFHDWCMITSVSKTVRMMLTENELLKEEVLERFLKPVGYSRWAWRETEHISLSLRDLHDYMRAISVPVNEYTRVAELYLQQLKFRPAKRDPDVLESAVLLRDASRAYNRVVLRLRAQAEIDPDLFMISASINSSSPKSSLEGDDSNTHHSKLPLFRLRRAPLLRVFIPSPEGDWLSDASVRQCEAELKYAGLLKNVRMGDVVWDIAVGDNGNFGRMIWDGKYLIDLDYTYSDLGDIPKHIPSLSFPPSYFHRVLRTSPESSNPIVRIDISPWGEEIAANLQLLQNKGRGGTPPQGTYHNTNWIHQSSFRIKSPLSRSQSSKGSALSEQSSKSCKPIPIPDFPGPYIDPSWYGKIVIETEGTGDSLTDLQDRCGPGVFPSRVKSSARSFMSEKSLSKERDARKVFRIIRERSRPGEIWIRTVSTKERRI